MNHKTENPFQELNPSYDFNRKVKQLLAVDTNAKTAKGKERGYNTAILYLVPYGQLGTLNLCPWASEGCGNSCLFTAGRGKFSNVIFSRLRKTLFLQYHRGVFLSKLEKEIDKLYLKYNDKLAVRLNGTSDINWTNLIDFNRWPNACFYDYTKAPCRIKTHMKGKHPKNYSLTFSMHETNKTKAFEILKAGGNVAIVFRNLPKEKKAISHRGSAIESFGYYKGYPVIDGDKDDLRFLDPKNVIVGLKAKGEAVKDKSGFVLDF